MAQEVSAVAVSPAADTLAAFGDTVRFVAEATDANGHTVGLTEFSWSSSDTLVARVDDSGLVESGAEGAAVVTAAASGVTGEAELTVLPLMPTTIAVSPDTVRFAALGQTEQLTAEVRDQVGRVLEGAAVSWSSGDTLVTRVDSAGLVTAAGGGTTTVTAQAGEVSTEVLVSVMQSAGLVVVSPAEGTVALGDTLRLAAEAFDENGHRVEGAVFSWSSSNAVVARVDDSGLVTGVAEGTATITATADGASGAAAVTVENPDRAALVALYEATDGPNWVDNTNWLTDAPLGEWYGVATDDLGRVVRIDLGQKWDDEARSWGGHGLAGSIPAELGNLTESKVLDLAGNDLTGPIPPELGNLLTLQVLDLRRNQLSGPIPPELGNLLTLQGLYLGRNRLSGSIPAELGRLTNLRWLDLHRNRLVGSIPRELENLARLSSLTVGSNRLTGLIPEWLRNLTNLQLVGLEWNNLTGPIPPWMGTLANLESLNLARSGLTGPIPPELGRLTKLRRLGLGGNGLTGSLPPELADLANLEELEIGGNPLIGPLPQEFAALPKLRSFGCANDHGFCVPGTRPFADWIEGLERFDGSWCNQPDLTTLETFFEATDGPDWRESEGWLEGPAPSEWYGVRADTLGRVTAIDLEDNALAGGVPSSLGYLSELTELRIGDNEALSGRLPISLTELALSTLHYAGTDVCTPADDPFPEWINGIPSHEGTGVPCAPVSEREILADVYGATGGPSWASSDKWLTDAPLGEWHGVETDDSGRVVGLSLARHGLSGRIPRGLSTLASLERLNLWGNDLSGPIPPALGDLEDLESLDLRGNNLSGRIPPELGTLGNLKRLDLSLNDLSGPIPPELGDLENLGLLALFSNDLSGPIPSELGALANLWSLLLTGNNLSGEIPPELSALTNLSSLSLRANNLSGPIPAELGALANLRRLTLSQNSLSGPIPLELGQLDRLGTLELGINELSGSIPPELGTLSNLQELDLTNNTAMSGTLPLSFTSLRGLDVMRARGTGLCVPLGDAGFQSWFNGIPDAQIATCAPSAAYLTQAVQSRTLPVPLIAGEEALLRVFVTSLRASGAGMPLVRARFYLNDTETHAVDIPASSDPIPARVDESDLSKSANAVVPAEFIKPGLEMVIEVDPDGTLDPALGLPRRIPEEGRMAIDVQEVPVFDLTVIPFLWTPTPDSRVIGLAEGMAADPEEHELLQETLTLLPVAAIDVTAHEPVMSSSNSGSNVLRETEMIRVLEGGGHYMGLMADFSDVGGIARRPGRSSAATPHGDVIAHELGHNMSLGHAPCSTPGPDPWYPYPDGSIGVLGYDFPGEYDLVDGGGVVEAWRPDNMSYCGPPNWISDYYFNQALFHRLGSADADMAAMAARPTRTLLLWGGLDAEGVPYLDPAFVADAVPSLPPAGIEYSIEGADAAGTPLFSYSFDMPATADADGEETSFVFAIPVEGGWADNLAGITLSGPDRTTYSLDEGTNRPMAILRNPQTAQVRGFLRDTASATQAAAGQGPWQGLEVLFSRGIPAADAWRR